MTSLFNVSVVGTLTVTLEQDAYSFVENADPASVMVCVDLLETSLNRVVDIQLTLREGSALSEQLIFSLSLSLFHSYFLINYR